MDDDQEDDEQLQANSPEPLRQQSPVPEYNNDERMMRLNLENSSFRYESPVPVYDDDEKDDEPLEADSHAPGRLFPVHQFYFTVYDRSVNGSAIETFYAGPLRRFLRPEATLKLDAFDDWFVIYSDRFARRPFY